MWNSFPCTASSQNIVMHKVNWILCKPKRGTSGEYHLWKLSTCNRKCLGSSFASLTECLCSSIQSSHTLIASWLENLQAGVIGHQADTFWQRVKVIGHWVVYSGSDCNHRPLSGYTLAAIGSDRAPSGYTVAAIGSDRTPSGCTLAVIVIIMHWVGVLWLRLGVIGHWVDTLWQQLGVIGHLAKCASSFTYTPKVLLYQLLVYKIFVLLIYWIHEQ